MEELIQRIEKCNICNAKFKGLVITESKPYLEFKVYKEWIPEQIIIVEDIPLTSTGKINKLYLKQKYT